MLVTDVERQFGESQNERDVRVERLWSKLDPSGKGELDLKGLRKGFRRIDHPLKNASDLLKQIMREVDTNRDGKIQYEEFRVFVQEAERQLFHLFHAIDRDADGKLDPAELQTAFRTAGLSISNRRLSEFFQDLDGNNDGYVSFDEWRNFLLFMPAGNHDSRLKAVLSFYDSVVSVTPEGDSLVSDETLEGLGADGSISGSVLYTLFGSLVRVAASSPPPATTAPGSPPISSGDDITTQSSKIESASKRSMDAVAIAENDGDCSSSVEQGTAKRRRLATTRPSPCPPQAGIDAEGEDQEQGKTLIGTQKTPKTFTLTDFAPDPGYFVAGAIAGGVSRTATAPLDRLKVYLLVNTRNNCESAVGAGNKGGPVPGAGNAPRPIRDAVRDLFRNGGIRSFFAGNGLNVIKIMPETAIKFGSYEAAKRALANFEGHGDPRRINSYSKFTAGGVAGMIAQFCVYPLDTLKFRLQCESVQGGLQGRALVRQTAVKMFADGGVKACYRGVTMGLVGMFPYSAIDMGMFELLKKTYQSYYARSAGCHEDDITPGNMATGMIGATSGAIGATVVYPLNVVRTRLQTQGTMMHPATYTGIWDVTQKTIQREGYRGLYKGLTPNLLKVAPALSITWIVYENSKSVLGLH
ncbi:hypothetical protein E4U32_007811 [Claviceps aff. humidiphila group G2b]|nr:hypothetical protein E4U32_007811 [Claviceps aff. humidiphila group G2b]